jgi:hypothetical protein
MREDEWMPEQVRHDEKQDPDFSAFVSSRYYLPNGKAHAQATVLPQR